MFFVENERVLNGDGVQCTSVGNLRLSKGASLQVNGFRVGEKAGSDGTV